MSENGQPLEIRPPEQYSQLHLEERYGYLQEELKVCRKEIKRLEAEVARLTAELRVAEKNELLANREARELRSSFVKLSHLV